MRITRRRALATGVALAAVHLGCKTKSARGVERIVSGDLTVDGAGVRLRRMLGGRALPLLDPFLLLDEFKSRERNDFIRGFPWHPHRGFETVTLMIDGVVEHGDSVGNSGAITGGGVQWMTAGHGIVHQEMPDATASGELWGYQLWVNLPAKSKMTKPRYQDHKPSDVPAVMLGDARARVLSGAVANVRGPVDGIAVDPVVLDVSLERGAIFRHDIGADHAVFVQVLDGAVDIEGRAVSDRALAVLGRGESVEVSAREGPARFFVFAGVPIGEPVARRGPFVMNTEAELDQAVADYRAGRLT